MARVTAERVAQTKRELLDAAQVVLVRDGFAGLSTRRVAEVAETRMSQIQYHFGSKEGMILALFEHMNAALVDRQLQTFAAPDLSPSQKWYMACDYLEEDISSGYVRVLNELIAASWSNANIAAVVRQSLNDWQTPLRSLARQFEDHHGTLAPFTADEVAVLVASAFIGGEALILLGFEEGDFPVRSALRRIGDAMARIEATPKKE